MTAHSSLKGAKNAQFLAVRPLGRQAELFVKPRGTKAVSHDLRLPQAPHETTGAGGEGLRPGALPHLATGRVGRRDPVVTMQPGHFFGQIGRALDILPVGRDVDLQCARAVNRYAETQALEIAGHLPGGERRAQQTVNTRGIGVDLARPPGPGRRVDRARGDPPGSDLLEQAGGTVEGRHSPGRVNPPFETEGGLRAHGQGPGGPPDADPVEIGALQEDARRLWGHLGVGAAHDPGHGHRPPRDRRLPGLPRGFPLGLVRVVRSFSPARARRMISRRSAQAIQVERVQGLVAARA